MDQKIDQQIKIYIIKLKATYVHFKVKSTDQNQINIQIKKLGQQIKVQGWIKQLKLECTDQKLDQKLAQQIQSQINISKVKVTDESQINRPIAS